MTISMAMPWLISRTFSVPICGRASAIASDTSARTRRMVGNPISLCRKDTPASRTSAVEEKRTEARRPGRRPTKKQTTAGIRSRSIQGDSKRSIFVRLEARFEPDISRLNLFRL